MSLGYFDPELDLLSEEPAPGEHTASASSHALRTAPIFTGDVLDELSHRIFPQRALYGRVIAQHTSSSSQSDEIVSPKLYINTNTPFSALVCGVQVRANSDWSRAPETLLCPGLGEKPLDVRVAGKLLDQRRSNWYLTRTTKRNCVSTAFLYLTLCTEVEISFHFDTAAGGGAVQPCEAAYLACLDAARGRDATPPQVTVLVL